MTLPLLISLPHAGQQIPPEVKSLCVLTPNEIIEDGDEGAAEIYLPLQTEVSAFVTTVIARAILDMNRAENDRRKDGIVKTHTCWDIPVYRESLPEEVIQTMIEKYYRPYHTNLTRYTGGVKLGVDCHTMAPKGPPVGPDPGMERPSISISNADYTCPHEWLTSFANSFSKVFETDVSVNRPFKGGYIIRSHAKELPWVQLELSRAPFLADEEKRSHVLQALSDWCKRFL